jgi:hypothetical protein
MKKIVLLVLALCAVGGVASVVLADRAESTAPTGNPAASPLADSSRLAMPVNSDVDLSVDEQAGTLQIYYQDGAGEDHSAVVDYRAQACRANPGVGRAIAHAMQAAHEIKADTCSSMKDFLATGATTIRGRTIDRAAGYRYLARNC